MGSYRVYMNRMQSTTVRRDRRKKLNKKDILVLIIVIIIAITLGAVSGKLLLDRMI